MYTDYELFELKFLTFFNFEGKNSSTSLLNTDRFFKKGKKIFSYRGDIFVPFFKKVTCKYSMVV